ncbi:hypothetical protein ACJ73_10179 [Blastomyces percursus]|uniref:Uncharacterized protein n=1 Tax=Blastomyces percursus TaxID=1658174 RepID=A0A1J9Q101_9EURO|nr:hypothetical protein ACJ73_10179 [Blastomyces percursus]
MASETPKSTRVAAAKARRKKQATQIPRQSSLRPKTWSATIALKASNTSTTPAEKTNLEIEKAKLEIKRAELKIEKQKIAVEKAKLDIETTKLAVNRAILIGE